MKRFRHIVVASDESYARHMAVTLRSLTEFGGGPFRISILHDRISPDSQNAVVASLGSSDCEIDWIDLSTSDVGDTARFHLPAAAYYRLAIGDVLDASIHTVLYLDTDVLVRRSLEPLWGVDLSGHVVAAIRSVNFPNLGTRGACDHWRDIPVDPRLPYFNSGVMMIDLNVWRHEQVGERALEYLRSEHSSGRTADQEGLNVALAGRWLELEPIWNQQTPMLDDQHGAQLIYTDAEIERARTDPAIIHYLDRPKPWHRDCEHPFKGLWRDTAENTAFEKAALERTALKQEAQWRLRRAASALVKGR